MPVSAEKYPVFNGLRLKCRCKYLSKKDLSFRYFSYKGLRAGSGLAFLESVIPTAPGTDIAGGEQIKSWLGGDSVSRLKLQ